ncbi:S-adenosyl-L-methionine-dependent methyltransferase [Obelidium mucronatum]|nr:S-adenosyl-L-methionine-dependent methyltransferase [Obelidium mucronatum]
MHGNGLISETWTVVVQGHVGNIRSLASHETFEIDSEIDGVLGAVSLVTFLEASRTRNFCSKGGSWLSLCLVSPLQGSRPVPFQALRHLETSLHPVLEGDSLALTGLDFEFAGKTVSVTLDIPKKLKNLLKREQEAWTGQRAQNLEQLKKAGIEASASILDSLDSGTPISYILGKHRFYGLDFIVSPAVMIPKPGTEVLLQSVIQKTHSLRGAEGSGGVRRNPHVLDLGTGSGCILVSLLQSPHLKNSRGLGIDLSKDALEIAKQNAAKHGLITTTNSNRIIFGETSFEGLPKYLETEYSKAVKEPFDYIVTNPPYLEAKLWESDRLYSSQKHEPRIALVGGDDGLEAYRQIYRALSKTSEIGYLCKGSVLFVEVNNGELAKKVETLFCGSANVIRDDDKLSEGWRFIRVDVDGKGIERCVVFEWK